MQAPKFLAAALLLLGLPSRLAAQAPAYDSLTITCARFSESVQGSIRTVMGTARRDETFGRDGVLVVRAAPDSAGLRIEAWYDSLTVFRQGPEGRLDPDAEGILGGRYRGILGPAGDYVAEAAPFVPAALRDVFGFDRVLLHFFPPLPPRPLRPGAEWKEDPELTIWRLADSAAAGGPVARYGWSRRSTWEEGVSVGDSTVVLHRTEAESGTVQWRGGPLAWGSTVRAGVDLPGASGRTEVVQVLKVVRLPGACR